MCTNVNTVEKSQVLLDKFAPVTGGPTEGVFYSSESISELNKNICKAALESIAKFGISKTSVEDIAKHAKVSRATVYRAFPKGRDSIFETALYLEAEKLFRKLYKVAQNSQSLKDAISSVVFAAAENLLNNSALMFIVANESELLAARLTFENMGKVLEFVSVNTKELFSKWIGKEPSMRLGEWIARILFSYTLCPTQAINLLDIDKVNLLVETVFIPGIEVLLEKG
jgi:AcrR family transcriptional regulator